MKHKTIIFLIAIAVALAGGTPALADYLGPSRTVTETVTTCKVILLSCKYVASKGDYRYRQVDSWSCSNESEPWNSYPEEPSPLGCYYGTQGDSYWSQEEISQQVTTTYPPATISGLLQNCTQSNGWCITRPQLSLSAIEPVPGYSILGIEGTWNNQGFACTGASCNLSLAEGSNNFTYWAHSSWTDTSTMGSLSAKVDSQQPAITSTLTGALGLDNWYTGPVLFNSSASDTTSGLASFTCVLDGLSPGSCSSIQVSAQGAHTLTLTARDNAGLTRSLTRNLSIDSQPPALNLSLAGTQDSDSNWYTEAQLNGTASDALPGSGLSVFEYRLDQDSWAPFPASGGLSLPEGRHTVDVRAVDKAGLITSSQKSFWLDRNAPAISLDASGTQGKNNWYLRDLSLTASASDETSGLSAFEYSLNNASWTAYTEALVLSDGIHYISFWAEDEAGLVAQVDRTYKIDTRAPEIGGNLSGTPGENGWFTSNVTLSASASDPQPGSGIDQFTYTLDGSQPSTFPQSLTLADGEHTVRLYAEDGAGSSRTLDQVINVDTLPPSLDVQTALPGWVREDVKLAGTAGDTGSGISRVEISTDGGQNWQSPSGTSDWSFLWNTPAVTNGLHEVIVRAMDMAGLVSSQTFVTGVDNAAPAIALPDSWFQWDTVTLDIQDKHSGLFSTSLEVSDPEGRWPARVIPLDTAQFPMQFKWDRRFADDTIAPAGTYDVKVVARDNLGNLSTKLASVRILIEILPPGPTSTPQPTEGPGLTATATLQPAASRTPTPTPTAQSSKGADPTPTAVGTRSVPPVSTATKTAVVLVFGSTVQPQASSTPGIMLTPTLRATPTKNIVQNWLDAVSQPHSNPTETSTEITLPEEGEQPVRKNEAKSNVLWGATAAAVMGSLTAYALEEKRKREEEKARQQAFEEQKEERHTKIQAQKMTKLEAQWAQEQAWEEARQEAKEREEFLEAHYQAGMEARQLAREMEEEAKRVAEQKAIREREQEKRRAEAEKKKAEDQQAGLAAYYNAMRQGESPTDTSTKEKSIWEKGLDWIDQHQTEIALGLGVAVGIGAIVLSGGIAAPLVAAAWVAGAAAVAAGTVAVGTVALNVHYQRPWNTNLLKNVAIAGGAAAVVSGGWFLLQAASTGIGAYCALNQSTCARVEPVLNAIDTAEELSLNAKLAYQTWRGDEAGASQTALELQMEHMDGGMPGNAVLKELGGETLEAIAQYGDEALNLVQLYGVDAAEVILKYQDEGIDLLQQYGKNAIRLIQSYQDNAIKVLKVVEPESAAKLLQTLDDDVLDYALEQGPDAVEALSHWSSEDLGLHGVELVLRSKKDAKALADVKKLIASGPIDPKNLTDEQKALIDAIAEYSTQYADGGQVVLGKWVDYDSGFVETARDTGSAHYNPHPDMWKTFKELGKEKRDEVAWLVNQQVIQTGINKGVPFEYTLNGIPTKDVIKESTAVEAIFSGATNTEILESLGADYLPIRMKELQELYKAGYEYSFDEISQTYIFALP